MSREEYEAFKGGTRQMKLTIARGHPKIRENYALDLKIKMRAKKAKKRAQRARRRERKKAEALRLGQKTPMIASGRETYSAP